MHAVIYCRISRAPKGDTTKVDEQERLSREACERRGWQLAAGCGYPEPNGVYIDNSRSAWQKNRSRPAWDAMLADLTGSGIGAIVSYWGDRLVRQPRELEDLIDLRNGGSLIVASIASHYEFGNPDHRMMMRWEVARACNESDTISRRKKATFERMARQGIAPAPAGIGGRAFGYGKDGRTPVPEEAAALRAAAARVLAGDSLARTCADMSLAGITSTTGKPMSYETLRRVLLNPRIAGLLKDGSPGAWEPILTPGEHQALAALFAARQRPRAGGRHLLSGIATCGVCKRPLQRTTNSRLPSYGCVTPGCGKVSRNMAHLDAYVSGHVAAILRDPRVAAAAREPAPGLAASAELAALEANRADTLAAIEDAASGDLATALARRLAKLDQRIADLRERAIAPSARLLSRHAGLSLERLQALPLDARREIIRAAVMIEVLPASRRGPGFCPEDVRVTPRSA